MKFTPAPPSPTFTSKASRREGLSERRIANSKFPLASPRIFPYSISSSRGRSSAGRALDWQSRGQGFDPPRLHHRECKAFGKPKAFFITIHRASQNTALITARAFKMLRKLLPAFVLCLLANRSSKTKMPRHIGHIASGYIQTLLIHLRQCEYSCKTTPSSAAYSLRVAQHSLHGAP